MLTLNESVLEQGPIHTLAYTFPGRRGMREFAGPRGAVREFLPSASCEELHATGPGLAGDLPRAREFLILKGRLGWTA